MEGSSKLGKIRGVVEHDPSMSRAQGEIRTRKKNQRAAQRPKKREFVEPTLGSGHRRGCCADEGDPADDEVEGESEGGESGSDMMWVPWGWRGEALVYMTIRRG